MANWPYTSEGSLIAAGYRQHWMGGTVPCLNCGVQVEMWFDPKRMQIDLDPETLQPHEETCSATSPE